MLFGKQGSQIGCRTRVAEVLQCVVSHRDWCCMWVLAGRAALHELDPGCAIQLITQRAARGQPVSSTAGCLHCPPLRPASLQPPVYSTAGCLTLILPETRAELESSCCSWTALHKQQRQQCCSARRVAQPSDSRSAGSRYKGVVNSNSYLLYHTRQRPVTTASRG